VGAADSLEGRIVAGRYRLERLLGAGGMGAVYEAEQLSLGRRVAVKVVKAERAGDDDAARRFAQETAVVARLAHPNIVTVYDGGRADDGLLFLAMELIQGETLRARLERGPMLVDDALAAIEDAASALVAAHGASVLHRDIKPENLILSTTAGHRERAKLLDFGIARVFLEEAQRNTATGVVAGTPGYIAPEQMLGGDSDARADLYALGVVLFEAIAGVPLFSGRTGMEIMLQHMTTPAPRLSTKAEVSQAVDELVASLLAKNPADRPPSAQALLDRVRASRSTRTQSPPSSPNTFLPSSSIAMSATESDVRLQLPALSVLYGRDAELATLDAALVDVRQGKGALLAIAGDAGMGKTRLADAFAERAHAAGVDVFWGRAWDGVFGSGGGALAFHPWSQALDALVAAHRALVDDDLAAKLAPLVASFTAQARELDRAHLFAAVDELLRRVARAKPIAIVLDDLHRADEATLRLLHAVTRDVRQRRIIVLATLRDSEATHNEALRTALRDAHTLTLGPLDKRDVAALITARLARADGATLVLDDQLVARVLEASAGVPLAIDEVVRVVVARGAAGDGAPLTAADVVRRRVARLSVEHRDLLAAAAVLGGDARTSWVAALAGAPVEAAVAAGLRAGVLVDGGDSIRFAHESHRDELLATLAPDRKRALHLAAARTLSRKGGNTRRVDVARHLLLAGHEHTAEAATLAIAAAEDLFQRFAFEDARRLLDQALDAVTDLEQPNEALRGRIFCAQGRLCLMTGDVDEGHRLCVEAAMIGNTLSDPELVADAALAYGARVLEGLIDNNLVDLLQAALATLPSSSAHKRSRVKARLAGAMQPHTDPMVPVAIAREAIAEARALGDRPNLLHVLHDAMSALFSVARGDERQSINEEVLRLAEAFGDAMRAQRARLRLVFDLVELGDTVAAGRTLAAWQQQADKLGQPEAGWRGPLLRAMIAEMEGRDDDARAELARASLVDQPAARAQIILHRAFRAQMLEDDNDDGALAVNAGRMLAERHGDDAQHWWRSIAAGIRGDREEARRSIDRVSPTAWQWKVPDTAAAVGLAAVRCGIAEIGARVLPTISARRGLLVSYASIAGTVGVPFDLVAGRIEALIGDVDAARASIAAARAVAGRSTGAGIRVLVEKQLASLPKELQPQAQPSTSASSSAGSGDS
jgi:hypothetical protein